MANCSVLVKYTLSCLLHVVLTVEDWDSGVSQQRPEPVRASLVTVELVNGGLVNTAAFHQDQDRLEEKPEKKLKWLRHILCPSANNTQSKLSASCTCLLIAARFHIHKISIPGRKKQWKYFVEDFWIIIYTICTKNIQIAFSYWSADTNL